MLKMRRVYRSRLKFQLPQTPEYQVLEQQRNGLQASISSMELEMEGNTQATRAMTSQARLLKTESRKQVHITIHVDTRQDAEKYLHTRVHEKV